MQTQEFKYRQWEEWIKEGKQITKIRNEDEEFKTMIEELNKMSKSQTKLQHNKIKVIIDTLMTLFQNQFHKKYLKFLEEIVRILCITLSNIQIPFYNQVDNLDFIKSVNKILIYLIFHHQEFEKLI